MFRNGEIDQLSYIPGGQAGYRACVGPVGASVSIEKPSFIAVARLFATGTLFCDEDDGKVHDDLLMVGLSYGEAEEDFSTRNCMWSNDKAAARTDTSTTMRTMQLCLRVILQIDDKPNQ